MKRRLSFHDDLYETYEIIDPRKRNKKGAKAKFLILLSRLKVCREQELV